MYLSVLIIIIFLYFNVIQQDIPDDDNNTIIINNTTIVINETDKWMNTFYYETLKEASTYSTTEKIFLADKFDIIVGHFSSSMTELKNRNDNIIAADFLGLAYMQTYYLQRFQYYVSQHQGYTQSQVESSFLHYKCDVLLNSRLIKGCNLVNTETLTCSGLPATDCISSTALTLQDSRVPDSDSTYQNLGWLTPNYNSDVYRDFSIWRAKEIMSYYPQSNMINGMLWDNILYTGSVYKLEKTIEYWNIQNSDYNQRSTDYNAYYIHVRNNLIQDLNLNNNFSWIGNVNAMYWIRPGTVNLEWALQNLDYMVIENFVSPRGAGEYSSPSWRVDCSDMQEMWTYTTSNNKKILTVTYNNEDVYGRDDKTKIFSIAKYYLLKNDNFYYGYDSHSEAVNIITNDWNDMANVNIGDPKNNTNNTVDFEGLQRTNKFYNFNNRYLKPDCNLQDKSNLVIARDFDNGMIIVRWKGDRWESGAPPYGDARYNSDVDIRNYNLQKNYYTINYDGTISATPSNTVSLSTNQAVILLQTCDAGIVLNTCGCNGIIKKPKETC